MNGFGLWCSCILLRLIRLYVIFILGKPFQLHWVAALLALWTPFVLYSLFLSLEYSVTFNAAIRVCLYRGWWYSAFDSVIVFVFFGILFWIQFQLRDVKDLLGENASIKKAMRVSFSLWVVCFFLYLMEWDSYWWGRAFVTISIAVSVICFFFVQNIENLEHLILRKNQELEDRIQEALIDPRNIDDALPVSSNPDARRRSTTSGNAKQRMFSEAVLGRLRED